LSKARIYAAMAQKERELITERTRAALGGDRDYRPAEGLSAAATAETRRVAVKRRRTG
jgi:DNA invertase Pin-like site-specific DNA recombinase